MSQYNKSASSVSSAKNKKKTFSDYLQELNVLFAKINFDDYLKSNILEYPTLYACASTLTGMKLAVMDQMLNTNGNGLQSDQDAVMHFVATFSKIIKDEGIENKDLHGFQFLKTPELGLRFDELVSTNPIEIMEGYTAEQVEASKRRMESLPETMRSKMRTISLQVPDVTLAKSTYQRLKEKDLLPPHVSHWQEDIIEDNKIRHARMLSRQYKLSLEADSSWISGHTPYPNFSYGYSFLYNSPKVSEIMVKNESWRLAIIEYYSYCLQYFIDPEKCFEYSEAYNPQGHELAQKMAKTLEKRFLDAFAKFESNEAISAAYEELYTGDIQEFLTIKWDKERTRIVLFIQDTLDRLQKRYNELDVFVVKNVA